MSSSRITVSVTVRVFDGVGSSALAGGVGNLENAAAAKIMAQAAVLRWG